MGTLLIDQLSALSFTVIERDLTDAELGVLIQGLMSPDSMAYRQAVVVFSYLDQDGVLSVLGNFDQIPLIVKKMMCPFLAAMEFYQPYALMLKELGAATEETYVEVLIQCLGRTDYMVFPLLLDCFSEPDPVILSRYKRVLALIGLPKIRLYVEMVPALPYEPIFREIFGDDAINGIRGQTP